MATASSALRSFAVKPFLGVPALRYERVLDNMALVANYGGAKHGSDPEAIRVSCFQTLNRVQPWQFNFAETPMKPIASFGDEEHFEAATLAHLMLRDELPEDWQYSERERKPLSAGVESGRELLREVAPETLATLDLLIGELVFGMTAQKSGGSISDIIGVIWLGPKEPWSSQRFAEALAHELVHHSLFLEDMTRGIFSQSVDEMDSERGLVRSALLQRPRGYDKSYHSALVSLVIIELASAVDGTGQQKYEGLIAPLRVTLEGLEQKDEFLTNNGARILVEMSNVLDSLTS